jgi:hypothetical protein
MSPLQVERTAGTYSKNSDAIPENAPSTSKLQPGQSGTYLSQRQRCKRINFSSVSSSFSAKMLLDHQAAAGNTIMTATYWAIGRSIVEEEQRTGDIRGAIVEPAGASVRPCAA